MGVWALDVFGGCPVDPVGGTNVPIGLWGDSGLLGWVWVRDGVLEVISLGEIGVSCENPGTFGNSSVSGV